MTEIQCPHCRELLELDDDIGDFVCPYCQAEFSWRISENVDSDFILKAKAAFGFFIFVIIIFAIATLLGGQNCTGSGCPG